MPLNLSAQPDTYEGGTFSVATLERVSGLQVKSAVQARQTMAQHVQQWRSGHGQQLWLSMLAGTMEKLSAPEFRGMRCDQALLASVKAHLARPGLPHGLYGSNFSLRN